MPNGQPRQRRYWGFRTDRNNKELLLSELENGRLRQGWGWDDSQDLRRIREVKEQGGAWWEQLTEVQREAYKNFKMLGEGEDSIRRGDIVLVPNLPQHGLFCVATVNGDYYFERLHLEAAQQTSGLAEDYGHVLPVDLLTPEGVNRYAEGVHADIRRTLRAQNRIWNCDWCGRHIDAILEARDRGEQLTEPRTGRQRAQAAWESAVQQARRTLESELERTLHANFRAAEWEEPIVIALSKLYPPSVAEVEWVAGADEHGADILVRITDHFADSAWQILIQVKDYVEEIAAVGALGQLETAHAHYGQQAPVVSAVVMTTADRAADNFLEELQRVEKRLGIPVHLMTRAAVIRLIADGLLSDPGPEREEQR